MKKIMIAILLLIPLIIIMTVNVSGMIISATVKISVESIVLKNRGEYIDYVEINFNEYDSEYKYYLIDTVCYPKLAQANLVWESSDLSIAYVENGKVYFRGYGEVVISCSSAENININAHCTFFVTGETIYTADITIFGSEDPMDELDIALHERVLLDKIIVPANALNNNVIEWNSSNESVVIVDGNGIIEALSVGVAEIEMTIDEDGVVFTDTIEVTVLPTYSLTYLDEIYIAGNSVELEDYTNFSSFTAEIVSGDGDIDGTDLSYTGSGAGDVVVSLRADVMSETSNITVHFTDGVWLLGYKNLDIMQDNLWKSENSIWAGSACYMLEPVVLNGDYLGAIPAVTWYSSDNSVLELENGRLYAGDGGNSTVRISADGFADAEIIISVKCPMQSVQLVFDNAEDKRGIEGVRVFGINSYNYDSLTEMGYVDNTLKLEVKTYSPENAEPIFLYSSSNTEYATVNDQGVITFYEEGIGHDVLIYIRAKYSISARPVNDYYKFSLVDGVNIGLGIGANENNDDAPIYRVYDEFQTIFSNHDNPRTTVLQSNVFYPSNTRTEGKGGGRQLEIYGSIYGNGFKIDGQFMEKYFGSSMFGSNFEFAGANEIFFRNVAINSSFAVDDFMVYKQSGGTTFAFYGNDTETEGKLFKLQYSILQYAFSHVYFEGGHIEVDGCILRNTAGPTLNSGSWVDRSPSITIRNSIFSNIIAPVMTMYSYLDINNLDQEGISYGSLTLEGDNYIYNWKDVQSITVDILPEGALPNGLADVFNDKINKTVRAELKKEAFDIIKIEGKDQTGFTKTYVNFSFLIIGVWREAESFQLNYDKNKYINIQLDIKDTELATILGARFRDPCYLLTPQNANGVPNTLPGETYELDEETLSRLLGN